MRLTLLAVSILFLTVAGCSRAPRHPQCDITFGQDEATASAWADANQAAKEARHD